METLAGILPHIIARYYYTIYCPSDQVIPAGKETANSNF